jgi:hypothetical protein
LHNIAAKSHTFGAAKTHRFGGIYIEEADCNYEYYNSWFGIIYRLEFASKKEVITLV